jgi:hypothetical protein
LRVDIVDFSDSSDIKTVSSYASTPVIFKSKENEGQLFTSSKEFLDKYLAMADPIFQEYFFEVFISTFIPFGLIIPGIVTFGQWIMIIFFNALWVGAIPINGPILFAGVIWFTFIGW